MKNKKIIDSWKKMEPDSVADERMLDAILTRNQIMRQPKKEKAFTWKWLAPVAACLIMVVAITAIFGNNAEWFGGKIYRAELDGERLDFYKSDSPATNSLDFGVDVISRDLTAEENRILFENLDVTSHGIFSAADRTLLHVEGRTGNTKVILVARGLSATDAVIETIPKISEVNGVRVSAGYFVTKVNSHGIKNIVYLASFNIDGVQAYVECGGNQDESDEWKSEIAFVIDTLTKIKTFDLSAIT